MRAVLFGEFGASDVLEAKSIPDPFPGPNEVRVRVAACGVNNVDIQIRNGSRGSVPLPHILGAEISGTVDLVGTCVDPNWVGQRVAIHPFVSCQKCSFCISGASNLCDTGTTIGRGVPGGYAELVVIPVSNVIQLHNSVSFEAAAAATVSGLAAWHVLMSKNQLRPGDNVLIVAGASGVGVWAIQIAKWLGTKVFATVGRKESVQALYGLGADEVVIHSKPGWDEEIRQMTGAQGVDLVLDTVGEATWLQSFSTLRRGGSFTLCGATTGGRVSIDLIEMFRNELRLVGATGGTRAELERLIEAIASGKLRAEIDSVVPLEQASEAHTRLESRRHIGKIILKPLSDEKEFPR